VETTPGSTCLKYNGKTLKEDTKKVCMECMSGYELDIVNVKDYPQCSLCSGDKYY
jgi:galactose mutarotase-like enzyme